jgi:hypothetical protein
MTPPPDPAPDSDFVARMRASLEADAATPANFAREEYEPTPKERRANRLKADEARRERIAKGRAK